MKTKSEIFQRLEELEELTQTETVTAEKQELEEELNSLADSIGYNMDLMNLDGFAQTQHIYITEHKYGI